MTCSPTAAPGEALAAVRISATTLGDMLLHAWDRSPEKHAIVFPEGELTYDELVRQVLRRARGLLALGIQPRDHVGILMPSGAEFIISLFAAAMVGATSVLINSRFKSPELAYVTENGDLAALLTISGSDDVVSLVDLAHKAFPTLGAAKAPSALKIDTAPRLRSVVLFGGASSNGMIDEATFDAAADKIEEGAVHQRRVSVRIRDIAMILYTSGTSANPKGCMLTHEAINREASNLARNRWRFGPDDRIWSPMPLFHVAAMLAMLSSIEVGATFYGQPHFDAGLSLKQVERDRITMMFLPFVTFHQAMIAHPDFELTDFSSVRLMNSCFAFMPDSVGDAYRRRAPNMLQVGTIGMTEAAGIITTGGYDMDPEMGFSRLGYPLSGIDVRFVDPDTGVQVPVGQRGEIQVRGYNLFEGYYKAPELTARTLDADGWFHSGDIGSVDETGHMLFHGRFKDMLKVGGENVAAAEVEAVLQQHPGVRLAQVFGLPDARLAEIPAAFVERETTFDGVPPTDEDLIAFARARMASFKAPRHVRFVEDWPMSASKIQKFRLRDRLMSELVLQNPA